MGRSDSYVVTLTREQMEQRRLAAARDLAAGHSQRRVADKFGVTEAAVSRWADALRAGGDEALRSRKATGQPLKLSEKDRDRLVRLLNKGAIANGYQTDLWTAARVAELIERRFGVSYHPMHVVKLLKKLGFRRVKPRREAIEKDHEKKAEWLAGTWVRIKKNSPQAPRSALSTNPGSR